MSKTANRIVKNTGFLYARMGITMLISLWSTRLILNAMGATDYGIFGIVGGAIAMLGFLNGSLSGATQRFMSYTRGEDDIQKQKLIFNNSLILHSIVSLLVVTLLELACFPLFDGVLNIPDERRDAALSIYHFFVISIFFNVVSVPYDSAINAHEDLGYYSVVGIIDSFFKLAVAFSIIYTRFDKLIVYGFLTLLLSVFLLLIKCCYCIRRYAECSFQLRRYYDFATLKSLAGYAGWTLVGLSGSMVGINGGDVVMNHYFGPSVNAAGSISGQLRGQLMAFSNAMLKAANPVIVKKEGGGNRKSMLTFTVSSGKLSYILFAVLALPFLLEMPYVLRSWLKNVPEWAVCFTRIQIMLGLTLPFYNTLSTALGATGEIKANCIFSCVMHLIPLAFFVAIYHYGAEPYWTYLIILLNYAIVLNGYLLYQCQLNCDLSVISYIRGTLAPSLISTSASLLLGWLVCNLLQESFVRLIVVATIVDISFLIFTYFFLFNRHEKMIINSVLEQMFKLKL